MNCMFLRRGFPPPLPTLEELFSTATIKYCTGVNQESQYSYVFYSGNLSSWNGCYLFEFCNGYLGIWKIVNGQPQSTPIKKTNNSYCGVVYDTNYSRWSYYNGGYSTSGYGSTPYGATGAFVQFSSDYDLDTIDKVLSRMTVNRLAYRNTSSTGTVRTNNKTNSLYLAAYESHIDWWTYNGSTWIQEYTGNYSPAGTVSSGYLQLYPSSGVYGGSIIGLS